MICQHCTETNHVLCRGRTWCDCQHRPDGATWHEVKSAEELTALLQDMEASDRALPPEILDAADRAFAEDTWVKRERPTRKTDDPPPGHVCSRECNHDGPDLRQPDSVQDAPVPSSEQ